MILLEIANIDGTKVVPLASTVQQQEEELPLVTEYVAYSWCDIPWCERLYRKPPRLSSTAQIAIEAEEGEIEGEVAPPSPPSTTITTAAAGAATQAAPMESAKLAEVPTPAVTHEEPVVPEKNEFAGLLPTPDMCNSRHDSSKSSFCSPT